MGWINKKFKQSKDQRLIASAVALLFVFTLVFLSEKFIFERKDKFNSIGQVISYNKDIQRKNSEQFAWQALVPHQKVFDD